MLLSFAGLSDVAKVLAVTHLALVSRAGLPVDAFLAVADETADDVATAYGELVGSGLMHAVRLPHGFDPGTFALDPAALLILRAEQAPARPR